MDENWIQQYYPAVQIPALARIRKARGEIAEDIDKVFSTGLSKTNGARQRVHNPWIVAGPITRHFAVEILRYSKTIENPLDRIEILDHRAEGLFLKQGHWEGIPQLVRHVTDKNFDFILYVGSQNIADTAKAVSAKCGILTGGVITAISSDGIFSDTAALNDKDGYSKSEPTVAPYFVLAHAPTLVRSPSHMKAACVADILTNYSALWDYDYSCSHLSLHVSDIARDFSLSAAGLLDIDNINVLALCDDALIQNLFRATELCGLSMQLNRGFDGKPNSATCSGSEHNIEKTIRRLLGERNRGLKQAGKNQIRIPLHGEILCPCLLVTLVLQGQIGYMVRIRDAFRNLNLPVKATDLKITNEDFIECVKTARGARANAFRAIENGEDPKTDPRLDRLTVLENIERDALESAVTDAMKLVEIGIEAR
jgi:glycerol dehydrogenase-like iron-containing ADH family enzyme